MAFRIAHFLGKPGNVPACLNAMRIGGRIRTGLYPETVDRGPCSGSYGSFLENINTVMVVKRFWLLPPSQHLGRMNVGT